MNARRRTRAGGRPKKPTACPVRGSILGVLDMRRHLPKHR